MSLPLDARGAIPSSPQELVEAAKDARDRVLHSTFAHRGKRYVEFYSALRAAYSSVIGDETIGKRFNDLIDHTVDAMPSVGDGRVNRDQAKQQYHIDMTAPNWQIAVIAHLDEKEHPIDGEQDVLWLLEQAVNPTCERTMQSSGTLSGIGPMFHPQEKG